MQHTKWVCILSFYPDIYIILQHLYRENSPHYILKPITVPSFSEKGEGPRGPLPSRLPSRWQPQCSVALADGHRAIQSLAWHVCF